MKLVKEKIDLKKNLYEKKQQIDSKVEKNI